jgi:hypothetical protein
LPCLAIALTTPAILGLYPVVALLASQTLPVRLAAWYRKDCATFSDTNALARRWPGMPFIYRSAKSQPT